MKAGVYAITAPSGKQYIGSSNNIARRWKEHLKSLRAGNHHCRPLQAASRKYGIDNLAFEVIVHLEDITTLITFEQAAFAAFQPAYNILPVAGSQLGAKRSEAAKEAMRAAQALANKRPEVIAAKSAAQLGKKASDEAREKMRVSGAAHRAKLADAKRGKPLSAERKAQVGDSFRGRPKNQEHRAKISAALKASIVAKQAAGALWGAAKRAANQAALLAAAPAELAKP